MTLAVVEFAVKVDGLSVDVKAVEHTEKLREDAAGCVPSSRWSAASVNRLFVTRAYSVAYALNAVVPRFATER